MRSNMKRRNGNFYRQMGLRESKRQLYDLPWKKFSVHFGGNMQDIILKDLTFMMQSSGLIKYNVLKPPNNKEAGVSLLTISCDSS